MTDPRDATDASTEAGTGASPVQTVLGPVAGGALGRVDCHEHVFLRSPILPGDELDGVDLLSDEVALVRASGFTTLVDLTPIGLGRDPNKLAEVASRTGVNIVAATGFHRDAHYPTGHWAFREPVDALLDVMLTDLTEGMDARDWQGPRPVPTTVRAGIIKLGASYQRASTAERTRLEAGARAALETGVPVAVHCEVGTFAHELLDRFQDNGLPPDQVLLAHMDRNPDPELHRELADRGAYLLYDTVGRTKYHPDSVVLDLISTMVASGHTASLLLGTDTARRTMLRSAGGGPGMDVLGRSFVPRLEGRVGSDATDRITRGNPARALTPRPAR